MKNSNFQGVSNVLEMGFQSPALLKVFKGLYKSPVSSGSLTEMFPWDLALAKGVTISNLAESSHTSLYQSFKVLDVKN